MVNVTDTKEGTEIVAPSPRLMYVIVKSRRLHPTFVAVVDQQK